MASEKITAAAAGTWRLGDLTIRRTGYGAMRLTSTAGAFELGSPTDRGRMIDVLRRAVELGVNHIDTAAFYFSALRSANELINTALAPYPDDLSSSPRSVPAATRPVRGCPGRAPNNCAARSRRTCAPSAVTTSTW